MLLVPLVETSSVQILAVEISVAGGSSEKILMSIPTDVQIRPKVPIVFLSTPMRLRVEKTRNTTTMGTRRVKMYAWVQTEILNKLAVGDVRCWARKGFSKETHVLPMKRL